MVAMTMTLKAHPIRRTRRDDILDWIIAFTEEEHRQPSMREIGESFHINHKTVEGHLDKLMAEGRLSRTKRGSRKVKGARYIPPDED